MPPAGFAPELSVVVAGVASGGAGVPCVDVLVRSVVLFGSTVVFAVVLAVWSSVAWSGVPGTSWLATASGVLTAVFGVAVPALGAVAVAEGLGVLAASGVFAVSTGVAVGA